MPRRTLLSAGLGIAAVLVLSAAALAAAELPGEVTVGPTEVADDPGAPAPEPATAGTAPVDASTTPEVPAGGLEEASSVDGPAAATTPGPDEPVYDCRELEGREICDTFGESDEGPGTYDDSDEGPGTR